MDSINSFIHLLDKIETQDRRLGMTIKNLRCLTGGKSMELAYAMALKLAEESEKLTLLTRALPAYTGNPRALQDVDAVAAESVPIEAGFTIEGWFCIRLPLLLPKKERGSASYVRGILYPALRNFFQGKAPVRYPESIMIFRHVYEKGRPERRYRDHDNIEINMVSDEVKVFNLVDPRHGDSWNCMSDLNGDTLLAQVLTNVIISNTSEGKGDHFWDNGEANLLKALVLYIDLDRSRSPETKNLAAAYQLLTQNSERQLTALFEKLPLDHPARAPFNLFSQASDTVRSGIVLGLGTRLQVLQNEAVRDIISRSDIDLTAPGKRKCAYFVILSDQDATMAFLSSLFFSFLFIKLVRYADSTPELRCKVPVNLIFDEFNNVGKLGGAADGSDFARTLSVIRSRAIYVMLAVQSLGQLQNRYPNNLWAEIVGNLDVQLMLGCTDEVSAEYFSARSGDMSVEINSTMTVRKTIAVAQVIPQYRQTEGQGRRRLLTPDEVLRIPNEELLVVIRGHNVLKLKKFDYADHPLAKELTPVSILDYTPPHAAAPFLQTETTSPHAASEERPHTSSIPSKRRTLYSSAKPPSEF